MRVEGITASIASLAIAVAALLLWMVTSAQVATPSEAADQLPAPWENLPAVEMKGGLTAFWNVYDYSKGAHRRAAYAKGFEPLTLVNTYADYHGKQAENISLWQKTQPKNNPWLRPDYFERIIRRNIAMTKPVGPIVHDIEFAFEEDIANAFSDPIVRVASGQTTLTTFEAVYFREWSKWFWQPLKWTKEAYPDAKVGLYGAQPFRRDYYGIAGRTAQQIDGTHARDDTIWREIESYADFYIASIYVFYARPDSVFYMAANVEENYERTRKYGNKPVYAYTWLRYHTSNRLIGNSELGSYLAEAMAIVPYFSGARGVVLWGYEPQVTSGDTELYENLPLFVSSLARVAKVSDIIGNGRLIIEKPAHELWAAKQPLVRNVEAQDGSCVVLALNPWQGEWQSSNARVWCAGRLYTIAMNGRRASIAHLQDGGVILH